jgi:hypothetical protein
MTTTLSDEKISSSVTATITNATEVGGTAGKNITTIVVKAEDGSSTSTYKIKFVAEQSTNCRPSNITYNVAGTTTSIPNFSGFVTSYNVELPYGTAAIRTIEAIKGDDGQEFVYTQPTTLPGTATVKATAADKNYSATYTINFSVGQLDDNKLTDIKIGGNSLPGFSPTKTSYTVEMPLGTTALPTIEPISAYATGIQTITTENTVTIAGETCTGTYNISVKAPGNATVRIYKLSFKITASTYSYLKDIKIGGTSMEGFDPTTLAYAYVLPQGTTVLPTIEAVKGDAYQQTPVIETGGVDGVTKITVTAASGAQSIYRITFSAPKSSNALLQDLKVNGTTLPATTGFSGFFSKSVNTKIIYENNKATSSDYVDDPNLAIQPNYKVYTLLNNQIIEKYIPSNNPIFDKKLSYKYTNSILTEIITSFPNMPYDPKDPSDYVLTASEKFEYDYNGNLIKSIIVSKHNDVINGGRKETTFGNYDNARNPFKKLYLLEEYFYKSLSKNNYKYLLIRSYDQNNNITSFSESSWEFTYDSAGNIILTK